MTIKLSPREKQIALLKQRGAMNKEIAIVLNISEETVKSIYRRVVDKCGERGVDVFAMPVDWAERLATFHGILRQAKLAEMFGDTQ